MICLLMLTCLLCCLSLFLTYHCDVRGALSFQGITIKSADILERAKKNNYPVTQENGQTMLQSPDGYKFFVVSEPASGGKERCSHLVVSEIARHLKWFCQPAGIDISAWLVLDVNQSDCCRQ